MPTFAVSAIKKKSKLTIIICLVSIKSCKQTVPQSYKLFIYFMSWDIDSNIQNTLESWFCVTKRKKLDVINTNSYRIVQSITFKYKHIYRKKKIGIIGNENYEVML